MENFGGVRSEKNPWSLTVVVNSARLHDAVLAVRDELGLDMLLDIVGIDYLGFKDYAGPRFAVEYVFKSVYDPAKRLILKVFAEEADLKIPTISDLYEIANWQEREVYDQYGVTFVGHPDLRRLLNFPRTIICIRHWKSGWNPKATRFWNVRKKSCRTKLNFCKGASRNESSHS